MQSIFDAITEWLKGLLVEGIMGNLGGLFTGVNEQVGEIAAQVGMTPAAWNAGVFSMIRQLSETVILPIAGLVLTFVMTYELIQMLIDHNNLYNFDTWIFFKWIFKTFVAVLILSNTFNIVIQVAVHANTFGVYPEEIARLQRDYEKLWGRVSDVLTELSALVEK